MTERQAWEYGTEHLERLHAVAHEERQCRRRGAERARNGAVRRHLAAFARGSAAGLAALADLLDGRDRAASVR